jgi:endonuclease/exonuclease/phosphatase family metal-dependent hydrolase
MNFVQQQMPALNAFVGSSVKRLRDDYEDEQRKYESLNEVVFEARRRIKSAEKDGAIRKSLRILTYNLHNWSSADNTISTDRIFNVFENLDADIICLNEANGYIEETKVTPSSNQNEASQDSKLKVHPLQERMMAIGYPHTSVTFSKKYLTADFFLCERINRNISIRIHVRMGNLVFSRYPIKEAILHTLTTAPNDPRNCIEFLINISSEAQ